MWNNLLDNISLDVPSATNVFTTKNLPSAKNVFSATNVFSTTNVPSATNVFSATKIAFKCDNIHFQNDPWLLKLKKITLTELLIHEEKNIRILIYIYKIYNSKQTFL